MTIINEPDPKSETELFEMYANKLKAIEDNSIGNIHSEEHLKELYNECDKLYKWYKSWELRFNPPERNTNDYIIVTGGIEI
jgi:hypothetical protein